mmetsp:Transcript_32354/g.74766  ORF Transcript_32354/g.74766 Transcript_32354/m.74766 type:complete len:83 (+) Transcript_32354:458-706(+)
MCMKDSKRVVDLFRGYFSMLPRENTTAEYMELQDLGCRRGFRIIRSQSQSRCRPAFSASLLMVGEKMIWQLRSLTFPGQHKL